MEHRLKQQRNKLFVRVTLILLTVCLLVSAAYFIICLHSEKNTLQNKVIANLSYGKHQISTGTDDIYIDNRIYLSIINLLYDNSLERDWDSQIIVINEQTNKTVINTAAKIVVKYGVKTGVESSTYGYGFLDYNTVRNSLTSDQLQIIKNYLNTKREDGKSYELICTKFQFDEFEFIPCELKIVLNQGNDTWFISDEIIDTFTLNNSKNKDKIIYSCDDMRRNIIPKEFLINNEYNNDYISSLTEEQRKMSTETISTGLCEYIFYTSDYMYLTDDILYDDPQSYSDTYNTANVTSYIIQYAQKMNLLDACKSRLIIGISIIFGFFFVIAFILCLMIWKMVKVQILQEQKRTDITNALAHDIKTPLFVISGYAYSLKENIDNNERDSYLEKIIEQTDEINNLVHKMLNLSKLDSYTMTLNRSDFDLYDLAEEILKKYTVLPDGKSIKLIHKSNSIVNADKELITTVLQNLIDNAIKYSLPDSEIQIDITEKRICISNQCEPLTKSDIKQIWQPYIRKDKSRHQNGNGLGLSIVKSILDLHEARYDIKHKENTFTFVIDF